MTNGSSSFLQPGQRPTHMVCPKCQLRQPLALDCVGCGAIIEDMAAATAPANPPPSAPAPAAQPPQSQPGASQPVAPGAPVTGVPQAPAPRPSAPATATPAPQAPAPQARAPQAPAPQAPAPQAPVPQPPTFQSPAPQAPAPQGQPPQAQPPASSSYLSGPAATPVAPPSPAPPSPSVPSPVAPPPAAPKPQTGTDSFLEEASLDFIPLADPPPQAAAPAQAGAAGDVYDGPAGSAGPAGGDVYGGSADEDPVGGDVYTGENPFSEDGSHSKYGTRGPIADYREGQMLAEELSAFSILGEAMGIFSRNFVSFTIIAAIALLPSIMFSLHSASEFAAISARFEDVDEPAIADVRSILTLLGLDALFAFICMPIATSAVAYGAGRELRKEKTTMIDCVQAGVQVLIPVLGLTLAQTVLVGLFALVIFVLSFVVLSPVLVTLPCLGIIGLFIPLFLVMTFYAAFSLAVPATVEERPGVVGALKISWGLTDGARMSIVFFLFALGFVGLVLGFVMGFLGGLVTEEAATLAAQLAEVLGITLSAIGLTVFYYRLRSSAERVPVSELPSVA